MENNYPIKYTVMAIRELIGWRPGLSMVGRKSYIAAYIVSKCYVISEKKEYKKNGDINYTYEVVFPIKVINPDASFERQVPEYNSDDECINKIIVNDLFDNFDDAYVLANRKNNELLIEISNIPYDDKYFSKIKTERRKYKEKLEKYRKIESMLESKMKIEQVYEELNNTYQKRKN